MVITAYSVAQAEAPAAEIDIDEAATRALIDEQLRAPGRYAHDALQRRTRPAKGRNTAIAEWLTKSGPADYVLFIATRCICFSGCGPGSFCHVCEKICPTRNAVVLPSFFA